MGVQRTWPEANYSEDTEGRPSAPEGAMKRNAEARRSGRGARRKREEPRIWRIWRMRRAALDGRGTTMGA